MNLFKNMSRDQRVMIWVLAMINFVNYLDRQVIFPLFSHIKAEFGLTDFHLGILATVFMIVYSLGVLPMGVLADKYSRKVIIGCGVLLWSVSSALSGLAVGFKSLLGIRSLVGFGEACYSPAAVAMISDNFKPEENSRIQGLFSVGMMVGGTVGAILGSLVAFYFNDWRVAFFIASIPGFIFAIMAFRLKDNKLEHKEPKVPLSIIIKNRAFVWITISGTLVSFAVGAFITWGIEFITRFKGFDLRQAGLILGVGMMIAGVIGVMSGSYLADHLFKKHNWGRAIVVATSLIISAPLMFLGLIDTSKGLFLTFFFVGATFLSVYLGPVTSIIHDIVPKQYRATAFGAYILFVHLVGEAVAPAIIGKISDIFDLRIGLEFATLFVLLAGLAFIPVVYLIHKKEVEIVI